MNFASFIYYVWQISLHIKNAIFHKKWSFSIAFLLSCHPCDHPAVYPFAILRVFRAVKALLALRALSS